MQSEIYRYTFTDEVDMSEVEASMLLAIMGTESLHGETEVQLNASHLIDCDRRLCIVNSGSDVGRTLNRLFLGYIRREFGVDAFSVERASPSAA